MDIDGEYTLRVERTERRNPTIAFVRQHVPSARHAEHPREDGFPLSLTMTDLIDQRQDVRGVPERNGFEQRRRPTNERRTYRRRQRWHPVGSYVRCNVLTSHREQLPCRTDRPILNKQLSRLRRDETIPMATHP